MSVTSVTGNENTTATSAGQSATDVVTNQLDRNAFMKLLITQMQYQDPMAPTPNEQFIAQLAQFSSLEQMQQMNTRLASFAGNMSTATATGLLGHTVTAQSSSMDEPITGKVTGIVYKDGQPMVSLNDQLIDPQWITAIQ